MQKNRICELSSCCTTTHYETDLFIYIFPNLFPSDVAVFDNSFSWVKSKKLHYSVDILPPDTQSTSDLQLGQCSQAGGTLQCDELPPSVKTPTHNCIKLLKEKGLLNTSVSREPGTVQKKVFISWLPIYFKQKQFCAKQIVMLCLNFPQQIIYLYAFIFRWMDLYLHCYVISDKKNC